MVEDNVNASPLPKDAYRRLGAECSLFSNGRIEDCWKAQELEIHKQTAAYALTASLGLIEFILVGIEDALLQIIVKNGVELYLT
mmetsp:Transcript_30718/g.46549  ORF Transcript_30718/g.46549 Transcript_30718/m.46549 type:complete len:84 (-) Transcript_30718:87-338(-)